MLSIYVNVCMYIHKGHLTFSWETCRETVQLYTKKKVKPGLEANPDRSLIGVLISLRTTTPIFSHGGERLTIWHPVLQDGGE